MAEKLLYARTQQKNDTEANWANATTFIPKKGEIVVYNADENNPSPRVKIGDGVTVVGELPFIYEYERITADDDGAGNVYLFLTGLDVTDNDAGTVIIS